MQQEDDLRGLAKIMDFLRAVSILFVIINIYWYCYEAITLWGINIDILDKILMNFDRTAGLFNSIVWTKCGAILLLTLSCIGTRGVADEKITWTKVWTLMGSGIVLFFFNWWILSLPITTDGRAALYIFSMTTGYICLLMSGLYMSRLLNVNLMEDPFNVSPQRSTSFKVLKACLPLLSKSYGKIKCFRTRYIVVGL